MSVGSVVDLAVVFHAAVAPFSWLTNSLTCSCRKWQNRNLYVAVIDGGSTGTRLHLFKYKQNFEIENEYFKEVKPGLSGFSMNPEGAANSVQELLDVALELTSPVERCHIPIILKATAGLRLLPDNQSENILKLVRDRIRKSGFFVDDNAVGVLSGVDEGVFSWVTVNLLLDRLKTVVSKNTKTPEAASGLKTVQIGDKEDLTVASLDLGGGSTQVTFHPQLLTQVSADSDRQHFFHAVNIDGKLIELYTHSYLGGGLIAARIGITKEDGLFNGKYYFSECFPDGYHLEAIDYAGRKWNIIGNASSFDGCFRAANRYIRKLNVRLISDLKNKDIYAFSYFYERANQLKLLTSFGNNRPGVISVGDYKNAAQKACSARSDQIGPEHWQPWKCLDLTFIYSLLHTGYGLGDTKSINRENDLGRARTADLLCVRQM
uniref:Nucleoside-diphosphatase mig-23 n=1 Tax=Syphacia muris TaxID=451379 RepID=A0A0N5AYD3_9BILA